MKANTQKSSTNKLVARFDKELKALLMSDLKAMRSVKEQLLNINQTNLNAA